jgi:hypothetical protein
MATLLLRFFSNKKKNDDIKWTAGGRWGGDESVASEPLSLLLSAVDILSTWQTTARRLMATTHSRSFQQSVSLYSARRERERVYTRHQRNNSYLIVYTLPWFYYFARTSATGLTSGTRLALSVFFVFIRICINRINCIRPKKKKRTIDGPQFSTRNCWPAQTTGLVQVHIHIIKLCPAAAASPT